VGDGVGYGQACIMTLKKVDRREAWERALQSLYAELEKDLEKREVEVGLYPYLCGTLKTHLN